MTAALLAPPAVAGRKTPGWRMMVGASGVVFGDIAISPLHAFRESFIGDHKLPLDQFHVLGVLSLLVWTLLIVVTLKYVFVIMRADNGGEGGSFALLALIRRVTPKTRLMPLIAGAALLATALFYGDAMITPAISILSAVEGLSLVDPRMTELVLPLTLVIVVGLFMVQRRGTAALAAWFGPIMLAWLAVIAALGVSNIMQAPEVLTAVNPYFALRFLAADPARAFLTLGTVVLAVTGAEALYADMGYFGRRPIQRAWLLLALPTVLLVPLILLSSAATVIASQSIISGAFSVTQQAVRLGYLPRMAIKATSATAVGQVYVPAVNMMLFLAVVVLVLGFRSSSALEAAFGLAVTMTMVLTTLLIGVMIFSVWKWPRIWAVPLYALLVVCDLALFAASSTKLLAGGWLPLTVAVVLGFVFATWQRGRALVKAQLDADSLPLEYFLATVASCRRVPGTAVFMTRSTTGVPPALLHNLKHNRVLHERTLLVSIETALTPTVPPDAQIKSVPVGEGIERVTLRYGFMESPDVPRTLETLLDPTAMKSASYFLSRETIVPARRPGMSALRHQLFAGF